MFERTVCFTCIGCNKLEDKSFKGIKICDNYREAYKMNTFVDRIIDKYYQERIDKYDRN